ncbi:uncharacterized protein [Panulirus ornatus]|uniref:uncharacterized protein isoform X5 n=1 Tax=Panulirus ornatus TaxID=150431 RepID=UPI003A87F87E
MRIITRRRVKVRVTVKRGDGSVTSHGWAYHRNREDDGHERKHDEGVTDEGVTPAESRSPTGEPPPSPEPAYYDSVCNDKNVHVELEEDADYEHPKDPVYESVDKGSEGIYEEVGRKGLRVRFEGDCEADEDLDEDEDMDGSVYSTGAIPKRGNTPASLGEEEEEEEEGRDYDEVKSDLDQEDDEEFYEPIGEVGQAPESEVPPTGREKKRSTMREESETCICDYDEPRKIEVTVTSKREGNKHEEEGVHNEKEKSKSWKRGKVEVKFSPWQTEGRGKKTRATDCKCDGNFRVDQRTELSYGDEGRQKRRVDHSRGGDSPYEVHHRSNIEVSAESVGSDRENRSDDYDEVYEQTESKDSFRGPGRRVADDRDDEDGFGDDENDTYQRSRPRLKKKTLIRVSGLGLDKELGLDADRGLVKTVSKMVVTFGRDSGGNSERTRHGQSTEQSVSDQDRTEDSGTSVIILETYGASPNLLKAEQEEDSTDSGAEASGDSISASNDSSSLNLSGVSDYSTNPDSNDSDDGNHTDHSSQTDTSTETLVCDVSQYDTDLTKTKEKCTEYDLATGALIEYPNEDSEDENLIRSPTFDDLSSIGENGDSLFYNFEEELERVERQYPNLQAEDLLIEEEVEEEEEQAAHFSYPQWTCETAKEGSRCFTITEEGEEEEAVAVQRREKLETTMGQYYSSASGGGISRDDMSGSLPSSPRSSEEWRMSMASTATVASTGTADSDDTVAKDMSELSSINSRLSYLDEAQDGAKNAPVTPPAADTLKATSQLDQKRQTSIKDAIDELESIEQAAQTLLQKRQYSTEDERGKPVSGSETMTIQSSTSVIVTTVTLGEKLSPQSKRKLPPSPTLQRHPTDDQNEAQLENSEKEKLEKRDKFSTETSAEKEDQSQKTEALAPPENLVIDGDSGAKLTKEDEVSDGKSEVKPPLPPVAGSQPTKADVKRRCWSRSREMQPYISRESYNDDRVLKELERLRRSYQESDLNDFLDALEHTTISDDLEEAFLRQLLADISEDVESIQEQNESSTQPEEEIVVVTTESSTNVPNDVPADSQQSSPAASKFEKVKERILEKITVHTAGRVIETGSPDSTTTPKEDIKQMNDSAKDDLGLPGTPQNCRPVTPQSLRPDTPDSKSSRPHTPDVTKGEDSKKGFNIADFLKKGSPKYLRKKYKERKNRKSDLTTTSESESEDPDNNKKDQNGTPLRKDTSTESHSSLKGSNRSLTSSQEVKKEVRFDLEDGGEKKDAEKSDIKDTGTDSATPVAVEMSTKEHRISGPQLITCEAQQQETVIPREFEETTEDMESDFLIMLPSTVEDINNRAESLLPRLPGRPRPPRKKKKLIPASVEEMSGDLSDNSTSTVTSDGSVKMVEPKAEDVKINPTAKEESPPPLPAYEEVSELAETTPKCVEVVARSRQESKTEEVREEPVEVSVTSEDATAVKTLPCLTVFTSAVTPDTSLASSTTVTSAVPPSPPAVTIVTSSSVAATDVTELTVKDLDVPDSFVTPPAPASTPTTPTATDVSTAPPDREVLVAPLPMTSIVSISVAPGPETATLVMYPPRSLPLPVIQESLHEDQVSLPTPNEPRVSLSSHSGSAPITPQDEEEKVPSLYDNVNPFKEMLELESKLLQDIAPESPTAVSSSVEIQSETIREEAAVQESETPKDHLKTDHFDFPQVACKSPDLEKTEIVDIDALAALTTEMFRFTQDMDMGVPKEKKPLVDSKTSISRIDTVVYTPTSSSGPQSPTDGIVCEPMKTIQHRETVVSMTDSPKPQEVRKNAEMKEIVTQTEPDTPFQSVSVKDIATSNTVAVQTDSTRYVRMYDTASQTDTEYETDLETESEMEENGTGKYDASKWLFRPTRQSKIPLPATKDPQMQELHKQHQVMVQELQQQTARQQRRQKEKPEVPPRQFQEKMPLRVVDELKAVLSESEDAPLKLKKVADPPPRRDSKFSWDNDDLATIPEEVLLPSARVVGEEGDSQQAQDEAGHPPAASQDKQAALRQPEVSPDKHVKGNNTPVDPEPAGIITTAKVRANVYTSFAPVAKIPTGKPPVPRPTIRRLSSETLEDGYQSDPGGTRRNGGRLKQVPTKIKPSTPTPEDRGYVTDSEVLTKAESSSPRTLRSTWTPIGHPAEWESELGLNTAGNALQELGLDESTLLTEIEQILGFGSLSSSKNRADKPSKTSSSSSSRPETFERPVKLEKQSSREKSSEKPLVPERDSSKGVWSPGRSGGDEKDASGPSRIDLPDLPSFKDQPSVWSPGRGNSHHPPDPRSSSTSPRYSHSLTHTHVGQSHSSASHSRVSDPRQQYTAGRYISGSASPSLGRKEYRKITYEGTSTPQRRPSQENVTAPPPEESFAWKDNAVDKVARSPTSTLPKVQNPTVTLLQKKRDDPHSTSEGQIPGKRPEYLKPDDTGPKYKPDDKLYVIKREYESEDEEGGRRFAVLGPKKVLGVGPTTTDGVPTTLKSGVKSEHQGEWYRRMFDSLHKVKDDDHIIIKYKVPRARYGGYMSEPEGYDSDVCSSRYATLDRRRQHHYEMDPMTSSLPRHTNRYVHQPGRIEDYVPGYSSLSEKELKKNPDADIKLESQSQEPPPVSVNHRLGSQKMSITHALKESGYESDSTLVFRKREDARRQVPDPRKTSQVYRQIQRGGDIPLTGLQKPNPPKPRDGYYVVYSDLDLGLHHPSLSDLSPSCDVPRAMSPPAKPPVPTFGDKKRTAPSKVVLAPSPPRRISSKWHPSLIKSSKDRPPVPSPRSTSAERVRETRALYSSWHREKVARSREKLGTSPARTTSLGRTLSAAKQTQEVRENFLKGRRTVSESRFTIEDREKSPPRRTASPTKVGSPTRQSETREKLHHRSSHREGLCEKTLVNKHEAQEHTPVSARGHNRSLSADSSRKWSNTSAESGRYSVMRHTVSSMNKIKRPSLQQNQTDAINSAPRSSSAESSCRRRRSGCVSPEPQTTSRKSPVGRKDSRCRGSPYSDVSMEVSDDKKLKQSESFDTTQSNETGYSSMLDLSPSPTPEKKSPEDRDRRTRRRSEPQPRPHSAPARRTRVSSSFHEQRNKWEALTRGEPIGGRQSRNPSRSTSPLRSLQLVRQVSSSFKDIPVEVWSAGARRSKSLDVLTPSPHSHPHRYRQYIMELRNAAPRNARISQLRRLFTSLDRVHRLERSVSSVELSAAQSRAFEIIDFETWKGLRERERKALEYNVLLKELNVAQKEREFLYKVTPEKKWTGDCRLRGRDVSVPELCEKFTTATDNSSEITQKRRRELESSKDTYRGLWRGSSVRDLSQMYQSPERHRSSRRGSSLSLPREDSSMRARGLWTSLSLEQVNAFRDHLTEIYGSMQSIRSWRERKLMSSERSQTRSHRELSKYNVDVAETGRALADKLRTLHVRPPAEVQRSPVRQPSPTRNTKRSSNFTQVEDERRQLSKQLSIELQEKVLEQRSGRSLEATPGVSDSLQVPDVPLSISPESLSRSSPRTCYSLDISDSSEPNSLNSGDQFLLLVQKPGRSGRSHSLPPEPVSDPETSDSEVSVRTVVHKDVAGKVKFFEKRARRNSRSSERHSSRGSRLNVDEVPHYATLPSRLKQQSQSKLLSPNYLPERSVSSVNLTSKADVASQAWQIYDKANPLSGSSVQRLHDPPREKKDPGDPTSHSRSYLYHVKTGEVSRLKTRYESPEDARRRAKSLPDVNGPLSRVTPTGRTFVRGQEAGDVQYIRAKYETPRRSRSPDRWQPNRDEYLPKSKLTSTLQTLAARSPAFHEPDTIERLARRDSIEKAVLRRVYTGNVEASVERLENKKLETGSGLSIIGQMYTSAPSVNELAIMAPLIPPRPPPPLMGPQKPQRMARGNPQPLLTSTPTPSPGDIRAAHRERALHVPVPVCPPPVMVHPPPGSSATFSSRSSAHYNADAHRPKSRYIPPESYGTSPPKSCGYGHRPSWTQSLERPHRVTRAMTHSTTPPASQQGGSHCYTLRHHHVSRSHHQPPTKGSPADRHTYSQPYSYTHTSSQPTRLHQSHSHHHSHSPGRDQSYSSKAVSWKEPVIGPLPYPFQTGSQQAPPARPESPYKYESGEVNIHYRTPVRLEQKEAIPEEELARRQEEHMKKVYENERRKKYLAELEDIERRRHTDNFTPLQKSPIPLNRYDDDSSLGTMRGTRTPDLKQVAKALYNFTAQNKRELTFNKGDVVFIRRQVDKNWYEGESRGSVGIFPCNYVEIVPYESIKTLTRKPTEGQARARFNFQAQTSMEMSLSKGELVVLTRRVDENWYEGRIGNRKGIFPVSYVDTLVEPGSDRPMTPSSSPMPRPALPAANLLYNGASSYSSPYSTLGRPESQNDSRPYTQSLTVNTQQEPVAYRALYNYKPQNDDELELLESDIVMVMEKCDDGWFVGTSRRTGLFGTFPGNYVERV